MTTPSVVLTGYPPTPILTWLGGVPYLSTPPGRVPPQLDLTGYPPRHLCHGILGNVAKHYGIWVPPPLWTDRWKDRCVSKHYLPVVLCTRAVNITSRRTSYVGGNNLYSFPHLPFVARWVARRMNETIIGQFSTVLESLCLTVVVIYFHICKSSFY